MGRALHAGMTGQDVKALQASLNFHTSPRRPPLVVDGSFGPNTLERVKEFQKENRLTVDGVVGPQTSQALVDVREIKAKVVITPPAGGSPGPNSIPRKVIDFGGGSSPVGAASPQQHSLLPPLPHFVLTTPSLLQSPRQLLNTAPAASPTASLAAPAGALSYWGLSPQLGGQYNVPSLVPTPDIKGNPSHGTPYWSPLVLTVGGYYLMKRDPLDWMFMCGGQFAFNANAPDNVGGYTGSLLCQVGPNSIQTYGPNGVFDPWNPFVLAQVSRNAAGTWLDASVSGGVGDTVNFVLARKYNPYTKKQEPVFNLSGNIQVLSGVDFHGNWIGVPFQFWFGFTGTPWF